MEEFESIVRKTKQRKPIVLNKKKKVMLYSPIDYKVTKI